MKHWMAGFILLVGCPKPAPVAAPVVMAAGDAAALVAQADALFAQRGDEQKLTAALDKYTAALAKGPPDKRHVLVNLTRGYYFWGDGFTTDKDVQIERWGRAMAYGNDCIAVNVNMATAIANGVKEKDAVSQATPEDGPCLYWTATSLGKWAKAQGISRTLRYLPTVKAYIGKVEEMDATYFHYGPARYWGAYYAALPSFAGQDFDKSAKYFDASVAGSPYYLATRVLRAEMLSVSTSNIKQFDEDMSYVLTANADAKPEAGVTVENLKEQEKARALLAKRGELFDSATLATAGPGPSVGATPKQPVTSGAVPPSPVTSGAMPLPPAEPVTSGAEPKAPAEPVTSGAGPKAPEEPVTSGAGPKEPVTSGAAPKPEGGAAPAPKP